MISFHPINAIIKHDEMKYRYIKVIKNLASEDWRLLELFHRRFDILWSNLKDLKLGVFHGSFKKNRDGSYAGGFDLPSSFRLKGLYVDYRHFYLEQEPTNYYKLLKFISWLSNDNDFHQFLKLEKKKWKSSFIENGWFKFNDISLNTKFIIDLWFNAEIFHSKERKKIQELLKFQQLFENRTAQSILFMAVYDTILVIRNLHWVISELRPEHLYLKMPIMIKENGMVLERQSATSANTLQKPFRLLFRQERYRTCAELKRNKN